jgi:uroporphyrinogen III methyltransferase / synthase
MSEGKVWLVGAGPGDPGLITLAGLQALKEADVVVYDRLIPQQLLAQARPDSELIYVGKIGHSPATAQEQINALLVEKARQGKNVVRLKGGDPFLFGRGGEEAQALAEAGIPFVVVPGVTSAIAVPAYAGIPVTHRGLSSSLAVVTGHEAPGKAESMVRWGLLAQAVDTLVVLMGAKALPSVVEELIAAGRSPETPAAVIYMGTTAAQRTVTAPLSDIARRVEEAGLGPPTVLVVGEVVRLRDSLAWYDKLPLFGRRVVITRPRHQAERLSSLLAREGAEPIELPLLEVEGVPTRRVWRRPWPV